MFEPARLELAILLAELLKTFRISYNWIVIIRIILHYYVDYTDGQNMVFGLKIKMHGIEDRRRICMFDSRFLSLHLTVG